MSGMSKKKSKNSRRRVRSRFREKLQSRKRNTRMANRQKSQAVPPAPSNASETTNTNPVPVPKVALMFLTVGDHQQPQLWTEFLKHQSHRFSIYCHPAFPDQVPDTSFMRGPTGPSSTFHKFRKQPTKGNQQGVLPHCRLIRKPHTRWGHLVLAYYQLLQQAFHDTSCNNQRFVFLSDTCVPCAPPKRVHETLLGNLDATYFYSDKPEANADRYDATVSKPWLNMHPREKRTLHTKPVKCNKLLADAGVTRSHFFKHSGWFSPNRRDTKRLLDHEDAFRALNMVSAGDEHILSILKRSEYAGSSQLENRMVTHVEWDTTLMAQHKALRHKEQDEGEDAFWGRMTRLKRTAPAEHAAYMGHRNRLMHANMHPVEYKTQISPSLVRKCQEHGSMFVRKVGKACRDVKLLRGLVQA